MTWRRMPGIFLIGATLLAVGCGSDPNDPRADGWSTNEPTQGVSDVGNDTAPDATALPDMTVVDEGCQLLGCSPGALCSSDGDCVTLSCSNDDQCDEGVACATSEAGKTCQLPTGVADGEGCTQDSDCQGGSCITDWPGGYCTTTGCDSFEDCSRLGNDNRCLQIQGPNLCVRLCTSDADCRDQYVCQPLNSQQGFCSPDPSIPFDPNALIGNPFDLECVSSTNGVARFNFSVDPTSTSYMVTPINANGRDLLPQSIALPSGMNVSFSGSQNRFQTTPAQIYGNMNPTIMPPTPTLAGQFETGTHTYTVETESDEVCWYKLEESSAGDTLDINVYLVGVPGTTAANAAQNLDLQATLGHFDDIYRTAGIHRGKIRYFDVTPAVEQEFSIIRDEGNLTDLVAVTTRPGETLDDVLSVNVFFVRAINMGGTIGISLGLPGPAGLHGTQGSGVVFTSEYMGTQTRDGLGVLVDGNVFTAQVLAHEVGHYLGLFHTSETDGFSFDPLSDTPQCSSLGVSCPDISNLMFPFASAGGDVITPDQAFVLGVNPLTKVGATP